MPEVKICKSAELKDGTAQIVTVENVEIGLIRHKGQCYAYRNVCAHQGGPACEGMRVPRVIDVIDKDGSFIQQKFDENDMHIVCPWHGYEYHIATGVHVADPRIKLKKFEVQEREGDIYVAI
jgi:nitrite reductase (NADH) small subunit